MQKQTEDFYASQFYKDWAFRMPEGWILLRGERVVSSEGAIYYPNGIKEEMDYLINDFE